MTTQKRKGSKNMRSKKYRGGTNSSDSRDTDSERLSELSDELNDLVEPYKKAKMWNNVGYAATFIGLAIVVGIVVLKNGKL